MTSRSGCWDCWVAVAITLALGLGQVNGSSIINARTEREYAVGVDAVNQVDPRAVQQVVDASRAIADRAAKDGNSDDAAAIRKAISVTQDIVKGGTGADSSKNTYLVTGIFAVAAEDPNFFDGVISELYRLSARTAQYASDIKQAADNAAEGPSINAKTEREFARSSHAISQVSPSAWQQLVQASQAAIDRAGKQGQQKEAAAMKKALAIADAVVKNGPSADANKKNENELTRGIAAMRVVDKDAYDGIVRNLRSLAAKTAERAAAIKRVADLDVRVREEVQAEREEEGKTEGGGGPGGALAQALGGLLKGV